MKYYLVSGHLVYAAGQIQHFRLIRTLAPGECMDPAMMTQMEKQILAENNRQGTIGKLAMITSFQAFETTPPVPPAEVHLNDCSVVLPPVDSLLLIEIAPDVLLKATRPAHADSREDQLTFDLKDGGVYIGRPRWTHP